LPLPCEADEPGGDVGPAQERPITLGG